MTHSIHASNVAAQATLENADRGAPGNREQLRAGHGLLNGGVPCYNVYRTADGRWLAVGALELKFWERLCRALGRPDWASRHWSLGQAIGGPDAIALTREMAEHIATHRLATWVELLEPRDCCVSPVLTVEEAREHLLFRLDAQTPTDRTSDEA
jgi:crotonobetainyl-CoA:carnitine CoA-transferase CaiB-like acyl-CoA transferase